MKFNLMNTQIIAIDTNKKIKQENEIKGGWNRGYFVGRELGKTSLK